MNDLLNNFHFLRPYWLLALVPMAVVLWLYGRRRLKAGNWNRACDPQLLPFLLMGQKTLRSPWAIAVVWLCGVLVIVALAGPAWKQLPQPVFRSQAALVIALDLSRSMDVADIKPNRLTRARHKILDILDKRREGQTALIVYAAEPFVVTPLTEDNKTVATLVNDLSTDLMPYQGSHPEKAIRKALELFKQASAVNGHVLLVTDGVGSADVSDAMRELVSHGYQLSVLAIGTSQGAPIKSARGGFVKDKNGNIVIASLDAEPLREIASQGQGIYRQLTPDDSDVDAILGVVSGSRLDENYDAGSEILGLQSDQWREEGPWLLLLLLPVIALAFRRGYLAIVVILVLPVPQKSYAFEWSDLWLNENQQAARALEEGNVEQAAKKFQDPQWKAAANYRAGQYQQAVEALDGIEQPDAQYNRGNALARVGNLQQAIEAYDQVLEANPDHEDARYNRDLLKKYLEQQKQNNDQQGNQGQDQQQQSGEQGQQQQQGQQGDQAQNSQQQQGENDSGGQQQNQQQRDERGEQDQSPQQAQSGEDKQQEQQQGNEQRQAAKQQEESTDHGDEQARLSRGDDTANDDPETRQMMEQWLRRIPDDPGGLLRRKFRYQSQMDSHQAEREKKPW